MNLEKIKQMAITKYGWSRDYSEVIPSTWLINTKNMLVNEIEVLNSNTIKDSDIVEYGYKTKEDFIKFNQREIAAIDTVLNS